MVPLNIVFAGLLGAVVNRLRGHDVFQRWVRMLAFGLAAFFVYGGGSIHSLVIALLITAGMLPGWPKWEDLRAMSIRGLLITGPSGLYMGVLTGQWWFIFIGVYLGVSYKVGKYIPNLGSGMSHWVEKAELLFGFILFAALHAASH